MEIGIEATKGYEQNKTGVGWYVYYLLQEISKVINDYDKLRIYINPWSSTNLLTKTNFKILHWPIKIFWTQLRLSWEMVKNPPDVLFVPAHLPPLCCPKKLVVTIHDLAFKKYPAAYSFKELMLQKWGIKQVLNRAWKIIVPSEFTKSEILKYYPKLALDNIFVINHGVDQQKFKPSQKDQDSKLKFKLVYLGRLESKKNIINLIKAFNVLNSELIASNCQLFLIGAPGYGYLKIKKEIANSPYKDQIKELGYLKQDKAMSYLQQASVFIFPTLYEGFGLPVLEAQACGVPVACSKISVLQEIANNSVLYFDPQKPKKIARKLAKLLKNFNLRQILINKGLKNSKKYTWEKSAKQTLEVLKSTEF